MPIPGSLDVLHRAYQLHRTESSQSKDGDVKRMPRMHERKLHGVWIFTRE